MMNRLLITAALLAGFLLSAMAAAHHGWGGYNREVREPMTITGIKWANPHDLVFATAEDGTEWKLLLAPPARNRKYGFGPGIVEVGDVVQILGAGHPSKSEAKVHTITRDGEEVYRYLYTASTDSQEKIGGTTQQPRGRRNR